MPSSSSSSLFLSKTLSLDVFFWTAAIYLYPWRQRQEQQLFICHGSASAPLASFIRSPSLPHVRQHPLLASPPILSFVPEFAETAFPQCHGLHSLSVLSLEAPMGTLRTFRRTQREECVSVSHLLPLETFMWVELGLLSSTTCSPGKYINEHHDACSHHLKEVHIQLGKFCAYPLGKRPFG